MSPSRLRVSGSPLSGLLAAFCQGVPLVRFVCSTTLRTPSFDSISTPRRSGKPSSRRMMRRVYFGFRLERPLTIFG
jgi:hypothetical protein